MSGGTYLVGDSVLYEGRLYATVAARTAAHTTNPEDDVNWLNLGLFLDRDYLNRYIWRHLTATAPATNGNTFMGGGVLSTSTIAGRLRITNAAASIELRFQGTALLDNRLDTLGASDFPVRFLIERDRAGQVAFSTTHSRMTVPAAAVTFTAGEVREITIVSDGAATANYTVTISDIIAFDTLVAARTFDQDAEFYVALYGTRHHLKEMLIQQDGLAAADVSYDPSGAVQLDATDTDVGKAVVRFDATAPPVFDSRDESKILYVAGGELEWGFEQPAAPAVSYGTTQYNTGITADNFRALFAASHDPLDIITWSEGSTLVTVGTALEPH